MFVNKVNQNAATLIGKLDDPTAVIMGTVCLGRVFVTI